MCECAMCGRFDHTEHRSTIEAFQTFGVIYCEFCAQDALDEEAASQSIPTTRFMTDAYVASFAA